MSKLYTTYAFRGLHIGDDKKRYPCVTGIKIMKSIFLGIIIIISAIKCVSKKDSEPPLEEQIRTATGPGQAVVVADSTGTYWAFPTSGVGKVRGHSIDLKKGTAVVTGSLSDRSDVPVEEIIRQMIEKSSSGTKMNFVLTENKGKGSATRLLTMNGGELKNELTLNIIEVLGSKPCAYLISGLLLSQCK